jgi:hypothetical protein
MFYCKSCEADFDSVVNLPLVLQCGHTFCKTCLGQSFRLEGSFRCLNCFYICSESGPLTVNYILCDRTSFRPGRQSAYGHETLPGVRSQTDYSFGKGINEEAPTGSKSRMMLENDADRPQITNTEFQYKIDFGYRNNQIEQAKEVQGDLQNLFYNSMSCQKLVPKAFSPLPLSKVLENSHNRLHVRAQTPIKGFRKAEDHMAFAKSANPIVKENINPFASVSKLKSPSPLAATEMCRNPNCTNPRYTRNSSQMEYCGLLCQELYGGLAKINSFTFN